MLKVWTTRPLSLFGGASVLVAVAAITHELTVVPVWTLALTCAAVILLYTGVRVSRNEDGWADALAATILAAGTAGSARTARAIGGGWAAFGVLLLVVAIANL